MAVVNLSLLETILGGFGPVRRGEVTAQYWAGARPFTAVTADQVRFANVIRVATAGEALRLELEPTRGVCCVKWTIIDRSTDRTLVRYTEIPDVHEIDFADLVDVDPSTFLPSDEGQAAWDAAVTAAQAALTGAQSAAGVGVVSAGAADEAAQAALSAAGEAVPAAQEAVDARDVSITASGDAETARAAAEAAASAASVSASQGATSAMAAGGSAGDAAGSATMAGSAASAAAASKTDADAARVAAEQARDLALAGQFAGSALASSVDLDTLQTPGVYYQGTAGVASTALHYPLANAATLVRVYRVGGTLLQEAVATTSQVARGIYTRRLFSGAWTAWVFVGSQRVDQTAGRAIYTWDDLNNREQLIYGDTGWRDVRDLLVNGWTASGVSLRRTLYSCSIRFENINKAAATDDIVLAVPAGFRASANERFNLHSVTTPSQLFRALIGSSTNLQIVRGSGANGDQLYGSVTWFTNDVWPATLPGNASGSIPNL